MAETLLLTRADVAALLPLRECIDAVADAFHSLSLGLIDAPATLSVPSGAGGFHVKAGILPRGGRRYFATKANGNFPDNPKRHDLPTIQGVLVLGDADDGRVLAVMDSTEITALRTAAATAVAARYLARRDSATVAICGCGVQGRAQLRALAEVLRLRGAHAFDVDFEKARAYAADMSGALGMPVVAEPRIASATMHADVCVTCTPATEFILDQGMVRAGTFVAGVGVDSERKRELTPALLAGAAKIVTDLRAQCAAIGDLHHAIVAGALGIDAVYADLADVVGGTRPGRETADEVIVFDSTGLAIQDVAAAAAVYQRACGDAAGRSVQRITFAEP